LNRHKNEFQTIFIGGAPRTGTTVLQAVICTSPMVNEYIAECSYFSAFLKPYFQGLNSFDLHTKHYFGSKDALRDFHSSVLECVLEKFWEITGAPRILALKDPMLTIHFHHLAELLPEARFVVTIRDPRDAVLSLYEVYRRLNADADPIQQLKEACTQYTSTYRALLDNLAMFGDRLLFINYNALVQGNELEKLSSFGIEGTCVEDIWKNSLTNVEEYSNGVWWSPLYGGALSDASVGRSSKGLDSEMLSIICEMCAGVSDALGIPISQNLASASFSMPPLQQHIKNFSV